MKKKNARPEASSKSVTPSRDWLTKFQADTKKHVLRGDYRSALTLAREALRLHPKHPECRFQYAKLLGDWADELPLAKRKKLKEESLEILRSLVRSLGAWSPEERFRVSLNYYYQSEDFRGMYRYGKRFASAYGRQGHYAAALAASYLALRAQEARESRLARGWARKAIPTWKKYDLKKEKYYFPHYALAMALAVAGEKESALQSLKTAAKLSQRTVEDAEFSDVLGLIRSK